MNPYDVYGAYTILYSTMRLEDDDGLIPHPGRRDQRMLRSEPGETNGRATFTSALPFTPRYVQNNLAGVPDPATTYQERVRKRQIMLENPQKASRERLEREANQSRKQAAKAARRLGVMNRKEATEKGLWKLKKEETKYELFVPLHQMWMGYMSELLSLLPAPASGTPDPAAAPSSAGMHAKLVKADFHGSIMTVCRSKNSALVGLSGIVIHETENAFRVVTSKNKMKLLPKHGSVFAFSVPLYSTMLPPASTASSSSAAPSKQTVLDIPHIEFELYGNQFQFRSAERAGKKFKAKETIEL
ncbi:hypothetical protein EVG20_g8421 [Dentipellis fragilis]|uniref:Uncharacterized protein n=1 Tax=Dentipellis fragilis TaxID=205917 RepID=A0A4Y9YA82_9AGAM|nr:hypothetical protein EVG20_g8421 [Dentipellis fragilis]